MTKATSRTSARYAIGAARFTSQPLNPLVGDGLVGERTPPASIGPAGMFEPAGVAGALLVGVRPGTVGLAAVAGAGVVPPGAAGGATWVAIGPVVGAVGAGGAGVGAGPGVAAAGGVGTGVGTGVEVGTGTGVGTGVGVGFGFGPGLPVGLAW